MHGTTEKSQRNTNWEEKKKKSERVYASVCESRRDEASRKGDDRMGYKKEERKKRDDVPLSK